ncbi:hypothetical protein ABZ249_16810 [Nocardiopsis sp. NPDC006139]|uniref:hypothetical protein n=1 Tax=unclassified Nocardiopsis TaxID=2649073 RepID=UPI0033B54C79
MHAHRPAAAPALTPVLPPGLRFPYAIGRPGPNEPTGPRPGLDPGAQAPPAARRTPPRAERAVPGAGPVPARGPVPGAPPRTRAVDAVAAAFLAGEPRPGAVPSGPRRAWFDVPDPRRT